MQYIYHFIFYLPMYLFAIYSVCGVTTYCYTPELLIKELNEKHVFSFISLCIFSWICYKINREHTFSFDVNIEF